MRCINRESEAMTLNAKRERFVEEYLKDLNATQAAIRAGYSKRTAGQTGNELLKNPEIQRRIMDAKAERSERTKIDADWVLSRLAQEAEADVEEFDADTTARDTATAMAQLLSFNAYCTRYGIAKARERFWDYVVNHGYTPGDRLAAWQWEAYWQAFEARDLRDTQQDALR